MNRLTNGKKCTKKKEPRLANQMNKTWEILKPIMNSRTKKSSRLSFKNIIKYKRPRLEYNAKIGIGLRLKNVNVFLLLFVCLISLLILSNRSNIMAYFTEIKHLANVFSVNAGYTITFNSNSGTGSMPEQTISYNVATALTSNSYTRTGYTFTGWNTSADGNGTPYSNGQSVTNIGDTTLFAQWDRLPVKYAVQIYGINEDKDSSGNPLGLTFGPATGDNYNNKYITHTYEDNGDGTYDVIIVTHTVASDGTETTSEECLTDSNGDNVTRTTVEKNKYDINMHEMTWSEIVAVSDKTSFLDCMLCGDTKSVNINMNDTISNLASVYNQNGDGAGVISASIRPNYKRWNPNISDNVAATNAGATGSNAKEAGGYSSSHIRATLIGSNNKTDVTYAGDENLNITTSLYSCLDSDFKSIIVPKKIRYVTGLDASNYDLGEDITDKIWLFSEREIYGPGANSGNTLEGLGASGDGYSRFSNTNSKYYFGSYDISPEPKKVSYCEEGIHVGFWLRSLNLGTTDNVRGIAYDGTSGDYGVCNYYYGISFGFCIDTTPVTYSVKFNSNGGSGTMADQQMQSNELTELTANAFTKSGYVFKEWNTASNGTGTSYTNKQVVGRLSTTQGATVNLYAQWEKAPTKYAVQIYGINQDEDSAGNTLGLTFGPAVGANYNNSYVTHEYEETSEGSGVYNVKIVTHTVAANGSETTSSEYLTDSSSNNVTRTEAQVTARENINLHEMTWAQIKAVQDKTVFEDCMLCGDTKSVSLTLNSTIASGIVYNQYGDGAGMLYNTVKSATDAYYRTWNPSQSQNAYVGTGVTLDSNEINHGSNARNAGGYSVSHIRATLIGKNAKTNEGYAGDVNLTNEICLYSCIESDLQAVITPKKIKYVTGTSTSNYSLNDDIADSIWLFSDREMYGTGQYSGNTTEGLGESGDGYNKFGNTESKYYMSTYNTSGNTNRVAYNEAGSTYSWWLRSSGLYGTYGARGVNYSGSIYNEHTYYGIGLAFGFCIGDLPVDYSVQFNSNGGTGTMANQTMRSNEPKALTQNSFTRTGYTFTGWNTEANGSGTSYIDKQVVSRLSTTQGAIVNLYAQWEPQPTKYAVQIYGINQDVDADGNTLGLTFGPAVGANYNNSYVTHEYEETSEGSGVYNVKIVTHTVAANGSETTTSAYLTDSSSNNVTRTGAQVTARENISLHNMTWTQIAAVSDKTVFEDCMLCGDTKSVNLSLNSTIASGSVYNQYGDGAGMLYNTVKSTTDAYYRTWNPRQSQNAYVGTGVTLDSSEIKYGSNARNAGGYSVSHIRATLIGKNAKTNEGYAGDVNLTSDTCLYSCIESDLQAVITPKKIKYVTGTSTSNYSLNDDIADSIWLFSDREMYGTGQYSGNTTEGLGASGDGYNKFGNTESKYYISSYNVSANTNRVAYTEAGSTNNWWLRSPRLDLTNYARYVYIGGSIYDLNAYLIDGLAFGFCIK